MPRGPVLQSLAHRCLVSSRAVAVLVIVDPSASRVGRDSCFSARSTPARLPMSDMGRLAPLKVRLFYEGVPLGCHSRGRTTLRPITHALPYRTVPYLRARSLYTTGRRVRPIFRPAFHSVRLAGLGTRLTPAPSANPAFAWAGKTTEGCLEEPRWILEDAPAICPAMRACEACSSRANPVVGGLE